MAEDWKSKLEKLKQSLTAPEPSKDNNSIQTKYEASMVLAGVGDAMGYNNGQWEFCKKGIWIHNQLEELGGLEKLRITNMLVSDDQVMHLATAEALTEFFSQGGSTNINDFMPILVKHYIQSFEDMEGRSPGAQTAVSINLLQQGTTWDNIPYEKKGGGCGAAMRSMCLGLVFYGEKQRDTLISFSIESGRVTHNNPTGFFGALTSAIFTAFAVEQIPVVAWGRKLVNEILPRAYQYLEKCGRFWEEYKQDLKFFEIKWRSYLDTRKILNDEVEPTFPAVYGVDERDAFYASLNASGWGGSSGHDAPMIAYDALLGAKDSWNDLAYKGILHGGDNDSTGCIAAACWGAMYGFKGVPEGNYQYVQYRDRANVAAEKLYAQAKKMEH